MKVAIVGVGGMGGVHFNIYRNMEGIEFVAACDIRFEMLKQKAGENPSFRLYDDYAEMLATEKPDLVDICTPTHLHVEQAIMAMESGANVLSEKPMGIDSADCNKLLETIKRTGKKYMTAQVVRFMNAYVYLREVMESGKYGRLESLAMQRFSSTPRWSNENWMLDKSKSGHVALDLMIHDIDYVQSLLGMPKAINGVCRDMNDLSNFAFATYAYDNCIVSIETGWYKANIPFNAGYKAVFENGYIKLENGVLYDCGEKVDFGDLGKIKETGINISNVDGYEGEIIYFIDCLKNNLPSVKVTPESAALTIELVEKTLDSMIHI
ncbi:MAG: Gfo/Idh/MocA family oxidoreductase [Clostridia bacterium]|nr:Gfo/Idh/MocA family oxidoreductase [Clostridia bacterium]